MTTQNEPLTDKLVDDCFEAGKEYWISFGMSPRGKELLGHVPDTECHVRAFSLFQYGFAARLIMTDVKTGLPESLLPFFAGARWRDYLRSSIGEIVLDGPPLPKTPLTVLRLAFRFFLEGYRAADCECVCRAAEGM